MTGNAKRWVKCAYSRMSHIIVIILIRYIATYPLELVPLLGLDSKKPQHEIHAGFSDRMLGGMRFNLF